MYRVILYTQWKWSRLALLPCVIIAFSLPLLSVQFSAADTTIAPLLRQGLTTYSVWYPALAAAVGLIIAVSAWAEDHRGGHVYALSLPVPRWRYSLMRFAAGLALLLGPALALLLGALLATGTVSLPPGLRAYPGALALRFALAMLLSFALFFAIASGTARTAGYVLGGIGGAVALQVLFVLSGVEASPVLWLFQRLTSAGGPLAIFTGPWMLIDV